MPTKKISKLFYFNHSINESYFNKDINILAWQQSIENIFHQNSNENRCKAMINRTNATKNCKNAKINRKKRKGKSQVGIKLELRSMQRREKLITESCFTLKFTQK